VCVCVCVVKCHRRWTRVCRRHGRRWQDLVSHRRRSRVARGWRTPCRSGSLWVGRSTPPRVSRHPSLVSRCTDPSNVDADQLGTRAFSPRVPAARNRWACRPRLPLTLRRIPATQSRSARDKLVTRSDQERPMQARSLSICFSHPSSRVPRLPELTRYWLPQSQLHWLFVRRNSSSLSHLPTSSIGRYRRALDATFSFFNGGHIVPSAVCEQRAANR